MFSYLWEETDNKKMKIRGEMENDGFINGPGYQGECPASNLQQEQGKLTSCRKEALSPIFSVNRREVNTLKVL